MDALLLFPHQLFASNAALARNKQVLLVEDALYFSQYAFHKQKLILHRASMRAHAAHLRQRGIRVHYPARSTRCRVERRQHSFELAGRVRAPAHRLARIHARAAYILKGRRQRTRNYWNHERALPDAFWKASTGIDPIDTVIRRVLDHAYAHHIERLMILGNFMQLCGFRPDDVYRWFMELFIDAYDWVMVPNVYGMALYADGGMISTKPYVAGSNYVRKMSDFKPGAWCETWDGLFWSFIDAHRRAFAANPRIGAIVRQLDRMPREKYREHASRARQFLEACSSQPCSS